MTCYSTFGITQKKLKFVRHSCSMSPPPDGTVLKGTLLIGRNEGPRVCVGVDPDGILLLTAQSMSKSSLPGGHAQGSGQEYHPVPTQIFWICPWCAG